jgi:type II secretory pathway pseudopilin PulG
LPLFALIFALLILGVLIGGAAAWIGQTKWRRTARKLDSEVRVLHQELDAIRRRFAAEPPAAARELAPYTVIPPPIP